MEMLTSGEYNLHPKPTIHQRKSILFVKLTDSAQRALANYLRCSFNSACDSPCIEFDDDQGRLIIPTSSSGGPPARHDSAPYMAQYKFDVISNDTMQGKQGRFECVHHKRGTKQLTQYGHFTQRLRIHATDDVYETTKNRMAAIELQQRKNCTVQLDYYSEARSGFSLNRKLKLAKAFHNAGHESAIKSTPKLETSNMIRNKSRPVNNAPPKKINPAACIIRKPLKERIVHLLALRPHKRPELEAALKRNGLRDCDKSHIVDTLMSVATFRDNTYHLSKHAWNDVQEDWLFYSESERQQIKKNKLQNLTSPSSNSDSGISVGSNQSPNNNNNAAHSSSPPQPSYKRPGYFNGVDGFQTKRQRISHFVKQEPVLPSVTTRTNSSGSVPAPAHQPAVAASANTSVNLLLYDDHRTDDCKTVSSLSGGLSSCNNVADDYKSVSPRRGGLGSCNNAADDCKSVSPRGAGAGSCNNAVDDYKSVSPRRGGVSSCNNSADNTCNGLLDDEAAKSTSHQKLRSCMANMVNIASAELLLKKQQQQLQQPHSFEKPKYMKDYVTITSTEQRSRYKADFNKIFEEYERVHKEVDRVRNMFAQLGDSLRKHKKGSKGYVKVEKDIVTKYYTLKSSRNFQDAKRRYEYLHEKLSHIKNLVNEYDDKVRKQMM